MCLLCVDGRFSQIRSHMYVCICVYNAGSGTHVLPTEHPRREIFLVFVEDVSDDKVTLPDIITFVWPLQFVTGPGFILRLHLSWYFLLWAASMRHVCMCTCMCVHMCVHVYICMYVCMRTCVYAYVCMYVCVHTCMGMCIYKFACVCTFVYIRNQMSSNFSILILF